MGIIKTIGIVGPALIAASTVQAGGWNEKAPLLEPLSETAVAQSGHMIYVFGGYPRLRITVDTAQAYNAKTDKWRYLPPIPVKTNHAMAAAVDEKVYVIGGQATAGGRRVNGRFERQPPGFMDSVFEYDPATNKWTQKASMPSKRSGGVAVVVGGKIYVAGGRTQETGDNFAAFDPKANRWQTLPNVPTQRNHLGAGVIAGKIYIVGGRFGPGFRSERTDALEVYDPKTKKWTKKKSMLRPRGGVNAIAANGCLHVLGGEGNDDALSGVFPDHAYYNPKTDSWKRLADIPTPVHGVTGLAFYKGNIHFPGGGIRIGGSSGNIIHQIVDVSDIICR